MWSNRVTSDITWGLCCSFLLLFVMFVNYHNFNFCALSFAIKTPKNKQSVNLTTSVQKKLIYNSDFINTNFNWHFSQHLYFMPFDKIIKELVAVFEKDT